jgi:hypothetical protein
MNRAYLPLSFFGLRHGCRRYGKLRSFFADAIAPDSFLRKVPLTRLASSSARWRTEADADVSGANSSPPGPLHPKRRAAGLGPGWPKPPHPRSDSRWPQREGSHVAPRQPRPNNRDEAWFLFPPRWSVPFDSPFGAPTIPLTWAEGRALLRSNLSAVPGANTAWGGTMPPSSIRDWHPKHARSCCPDVHVQVVTTLPVGNRLVAVSRRPVAPVPDRDTPRNNMRVGSGRPGTRAYGPSAGHAWGAGPVRAARHRPERGRRATCC